MKRVDVEKEISLRICESADEWESVWNGGYIRGFLDAAEWFVNSTWHTLKT